MLFCGKWKVIKIKKKVSFYDGDRFISIEPSKLSLDIDFEIQYKNTLIGNQRNCIDVYKSDLNDILIQEPFVYMKTLKSLDQ